MRVRVPILALVALATVACQPNRSLSGTWDATGLPQMQGSTVTMTFGSNGNLRGNFALNMPGMGTELKITTEGTYRLEGDKLTTKLDKYDAPDLPALFKAQFDQSMQQQLGKETVYTLQWINNDEVTLAGTDGTLTLKRQGANVTK